MNVPVTRTLESSFPRKRPQSAGAARAHASSSPGGPFGTELNSIVPPSPQPRAPRPGVDSATAPWLNPANQYDQVKSHSGKRIAVSHAPTSTTHTHTHTFSLVRGVHP